LQDATYSLIQLFADGGWMMYPLLLASLLGLGVTIAKGYVLWVAHRETRRVLDEAEALARQGRLDEAIAMAEETPGPVSAILISGLRQVRAHRQDVEVEQAMTATGTIELGFLERGLVVLATVATVAPLLGFLGTVWGMILAFEAIEIAGQVEATLVAGGIKIALITTATGLLIAIPANVMYNFFVTRIDRLIVGMEEGTNAVLNVFWDMNPVAAGSTLGATAGGRSRSPEPMVRPDTGKTTGESEQRRPE
jgi:biopolymer transport protein ExbB